jgi:uncharacterized protein (UPF0212 family)
MKAIVRINLRLAAKCPHCEENINILDVEKNDFEGRISKRVVAGKWDQVSGLSVECPKCSEKFEIDFLVY